MTQFKTLEMPTQTKLLVVSNSGEAKAYFDAFNLDPTVWRVARWGEALTGLGFYRIVAIQPKELTYTHAQYFSQALMSRLLNKDCSCILL